MFPSDLSSFSTQELLKIAGSQESPSKSSGDFGHLSNEELLKAAGVDGESSYFDKALGLGKGLASGLGGGALDTAALIYNLPAMLHNMSIKASQKNPEMFKGSEYEQIPGTAVQEELPMIPSAVQGIEKGIESLGIKTPENMKGTYEGMKLAGELAGTGGLGKIAGKAGMKGIQSVGKTLGVTNPIELAASVPFGAAMHNVGEEYGPVAGLGAGALTGVGATKALKTAQGFGKGLKGTLTGKGESLGDMTIGQAMSKLGKPSAEIENLAKKEGITLPFNIRLKGPVSNFLANTGLNSVFTAQKYKDFIENSPKQVMDRIVKRIDEVHPENIGSEASSKEAQHYMTKEQEEIENNAKNIYETAETFLTDKDKVKIDPVIKAMHELRSDLSAPVPSEPMKFVTNRVENLAKAWGVISPSKLQKELGGESQFGSYDNILKAISKNGKEIPLQELIQQRSAFMHDLRNKDAYGAQRQLGRLIKALDETISTSNNKEFLNHWRAGNDYYKTEVANRVRGDVARSITEGTFPKQAYDFMTSPDKINELSRILGTSSQANKIVNSLKRSKLEDVLTSRITNADGSIRFGSFADMFKKGNKNQDLLRSLLGNKSYNDLSELSHIAEVYSKAGKEFSNPSGTATRGQDIGKIVLGLSSIPTALVGGLGAGAATAGTAALYTMTPYVLSRVLSNPKYTDAAIKYAKARIEKKNTSPYEKLTKSIFIQTAKKALPHTAKESIQKEY